MGASRDDYEVGATYRALGIVGQRESAKGLNDGYRLWPRSIEDVRRFARADHDAEPQLDGGRKPNATRLTDASAHADATPDRDATPHCDTAPDRHPRVRRARR